MADYNEGNYMTLPAAAVMASAFLLGKINASGQFALCAADTNRDVIGVNMEPAAAIGQQIRVGAVNQFAYYKCQTDATAVIVGSPLYKGAAGTVSITAAGSTLVGYALDANGSVAGVVVRVLPVNV
jgi:hypothetical protein